MKWGRRYYCTNGEFSSQVEMQSIENVEHDIKVSVVNIF